MPDHLTERASVVGALAEPARHALYRYVAAQPDAVSREQAAAAVDLPLHSAKFHLEHLARAGLLDVEFRRLTGRTGPGAGRPAKLYRRSAGEVSVSIPERHYDLAGDVLAAAVELSLTDAVPVDEAVRVAARAAGRRLAGDPEPAASTDDPSDAARTARFLSAHGYEPRVAEAEICLANCPFDRMASEHTELVCGLNLALIDGALEGLGVDTLTPRLAPETGLCCVKIAR